MKPRAAIKPSTVDGTRSAQDDAPRCTGVDGNRTHQRPRERPLNGFEGRGTDPVSIETTDTYDSYDSHGTTSGTKPAPIDPDLAAVVKAWPELPEAVKAGIVAMVKAASEGEGAAEGR